MFITKLSFYISVIILITQRQETCNHLVSLDQLDMFAQKYEDISLITNATVLNAMFVDY